MYRDRIIRISNLYLPLKPTHIAILLFLYINKKTTGKEIDITERPTFYVYIRELIKKGCVISEVDKKDNRRKYYYLTEFGNEIAKRLYEIFIFLNNNNKQYAVNNTKE